MKLNRRTTLACLAALFAFSTAWSDDMGDVCRALVAEHGDAVVRVRVTFKESVDWGGMGSDSSEWTSEIPGTVVAPDGTTVVSLFNTDPSAMFEDFISEMEEDEVDLEVTLTAVGILLGAGKEIPAKVVLRDQDLDLAILKPESRLKGALPFIDLKQAGTAEAFDRVVFLERMGRVAARLCTAYEGRIAGILEKRRRLYVVPTGSLGAPAYTMNRELLGLAVIRRIKGGSDMNMFTGELDNETTVVLPAEDVLEVVKQADGDGKGEVKGE